MQTVTDQSDGPPVEQPVGQPAAPEKDDPQDIVGIIQRRTDELYAEHQLAIYKRTDRWFAYLMIFQWLAGVAAALLVSPLAWSGSTSEPHIHVWAAIFLGGIISALPVCLALTRPGETITRHTIAVGQMLTSALLIHLTGGRIETHFHVFGSLAFLSFYRDWRVLITASAVIGVDHLLRGIFFPQSVFGTLTASSWRWLEHVGWVAFEDLFLALGIVQSTREMKYIAMRQAELELTNKLIEAKVVERTAQLSQRAKELEELNNLLSESEKAKSGLVKELSRSNNELEQFAYVASHDLQEPLRKVVAFGDQLRTTAGDELSEDSLDSLQRMQAAATRMKSMIESLLELSRVHSRASTFKDINLYDVVKQVLSDLEVRVEQTGAKVKVEALPVVHGDPTQIHQLMLNLVGNALKFKRSDVVPEIRIFADGIGAGCQIVVEDNGIGFDEKHTEKVFAVFQRLHGREYEGSGIGLALCRKIALRHGGDITVKSKVGVGSSFIISLPLSRDEEIVQEGIAEDARSATGRAGKTENAENAGGKTGNTGNTGSIEPSANSAGNIENSGNAKSAGNTGITGITGD